MEKRQPSGYQARELSDILSRAQSLVQTIQSIPGCCSTSTSEAAGQIPMTPGASNISPIIVEDSISSKTSQPAATTKWDTWTHDFLCLANRDQSYPPNQPEKLKLIYAGLGRRKICLNNNDDASHFKLEEVFLKLKIAGGSKFYDHKDK